MSRSSVQHGLTRFRSLLNASGVAALHGREEGMISIVSVVVLLFIVVLIALIINVGHTINRKLEVQNSADAVGYTSAIWMARGMNVITASNHIIGEIQALVVLHIAIGGEELEGERPLDPQEAQAAQARLDSAAAELKVAWEAAKALGASTPADPNGNDLVGERVTSGATFRAGMTDLKRALAKVYEAKAGAKLAELSLYPPAVAIGEAVELVATAVELDILAEYTVLKGMETFAKATIPFSRFLFNTMLPGARDFETFVVESVPGIAAGAGKAIAQQNQTTGAIYPREPPMPVLREKPRGDADIPRSALVRATYPWVIYDRTPVLRMTRWMIFSNTRKHYLKYTDSYTFLKSKELYGKGFTMYVMTKPGETKGNEPWTRNSHRADRKFTLVGFAHRPSVTLSSQPVFGLPNRDGMVACAQAIVYNANSQNPGNGPPTYQPEVGWDTLNWLPPVTSSGAYEYKFGPEESDLCPRIKVNWQAKLVPVSRLAEAAQSGEVGGPFGSVLGRVGSDARRYLTH